MPQLCRNNICIRVINATVISSYFSNPYSSCLRNKFVLNLVDSFAAVLVHELEFIAYI